MDLKEKELVRLILTNCRMSFRELGTKIGLSASSVKKRLDFLIESGFIESFGVYINQDSTNIRLSNIIVYTDSSLPIKVFMDAVQKHEGVYLVYPLISGDYYVGFDYSEDEDFDALCETVQHLEGVFRIERYNRQYDLDKKNKPDAPEFSLNELKILKQLLADVRMPIHEIASRSGLPIKKARRIMDDFEDGKRVLFTGTWNPNLGRSLTFTSIIRHDTGSFSTTDFLDWLEKTYPTDYWATRDYPSHQTMFSFFITENLSSMETISQAILDYPEVKSCSTYIHYTAFNRSPLSRIRLERLVEQGL
ncbi:MAG: winged helix-turn-helix transcriptional regulator [Candidatus Thorarchaeota archaeon]